MAGRLNTDWHVLFVETPRETPERIDAEDQHGLQLRIGIHTGAVVAGVIGKRKFIYDLWGDTVNTASRMESHGIPDEIHVTEETRRLLMDSYAFEERGEIDVKGKEQHPLYKYITKDSPFPGDVKWNFQKYLVDRSGKIVAKYMSAVDPMSNDVRKDVEKYLGEKSLGAK